MPELMGVLKHPEHPPGFQDSLAVARVPNLQLLHAASRQWCNNASCYCLDVLNPLNHNIAVYQNLCRTMLAHIYMYTRIIAKTFAHMTKIFILC